MFIEAVLARKSALRNDLLAQLTQALEAARAAHAAAVEGATHTEARAENDKDTRGLEQSYLARGQAQRVAELEVGVANVEAMTLRGFTEDDAIASGALITVVEDRDSHGPDEDRDSHGPDANRTRYFMAPAGGGSAIGEVQIITPASPIGRALVGKRAGDVVELKVGARTRELEIEEVA